MRASRPYMPGYGTDRSETGLLPWSWADDRLRTSFSYWIGSVRPDGRPHIMAIWAVWERDALWFGSTNASRKVRNLRADPRCTITVDDTLNPIVLDGIATFVTDPDDIAWYCDAANAKYSSNYSHNPDHGSVLVVRPTWAFGMQAADLPGTATRWRP